MERITSFWEALQVWPSKQGILLGVAAFLVIIILARASSVAELLFNTMLAVAIGFLVAHAVG